MSPWVRPRVGSGAPGARTRPRSPDTGCTATNSADLLSGTTAARDSTTHRPVFATTTQRSATTTTATTTVATPRRPSGGEEHRLELLDRDVGAGDAEEPGPVPGPEGVRVDLRVAPRKSMYGPPRRAGRTALPPDEVPFAAGDRARCYDDAPPMAADARSRSWTQPRSGWRSARPRVVRADAATGRGRHPIPVIVAKTPSRTAASVPAVACPRACPQRRAERRGRPGERPGDGLVGAQPTLRHDHRGAEGMPELSGTSPALR
jgi:hypothetical protein